MNSDRWAEIEAVLDDALARPASEWPALLERACGDDADLRRAVEDLLQRRAKLGDFLNQSVDSVEAAVAIATSQGAAFWPGDGARIGPYRLVREIAHGGMASVFLAERDDGEFVQTVALKLLREGLGTAESESRFRTERQILATLNHPNIARLLDGGMTSVGLPFLVMEYVDGVSIDRFCDRRQLTIAERLQLFLRVTDAVRYAHRNLVVHRDLKPSNILIAADGDVKLLDFGIAKLLSQDRLEPVTATGHRWMTPEYAAPEQLGGGRVTTATDVYQLGLLLYELLTGCRPFTRDGITSPSTLHDRASALPEPPSTIVSRDSDETVDIAGTRRTDRLGLRRMLRGDLDAIVLKALRPEPELRYLSVDALRDDIDRYLAGRPVRARQGSASYRAKKFMHRHRWGMAAAAAILLLIAGYISTITIQTGHVRRALQRAREQQSKAEGATQYLIGLFNSGNSGLNPGEMLNARQLLDLGEQEAAQLSDPLAQAQLLSVLGRVHHNMRSFERAERLLTRALTIRRNVLGAEHADVAESLVELGLLNRDRGRYDQARQEYQQALGIQRRILGNDHPAIAQTLLRLAYITSMPIDASIALMREALAARVRAHGPDHTLVAEDMLYLGTMIRRKGQLEEGEAWLREALRLWQRTLGPEHQNVARAMRQISFTLFDRGEVAAAITMQRNALTMLERLVGAHHVELRGPLAGFAGMLQSARQLDEAEVLLRRALAITERSWSTDHGEYATSLAQLAGLLREKGELDEAETLRRRELGILRNIYGDNHTFVAGSLHNLALIMQDRGDLAEAERVLLQAKAIRAGIFGPESVQTALLSNALGTVARLRTHLAAAESLHLSALHIYRRNGFSDENRNMQAAHQELVALYELWRKPELAARHRAKLLRK